MQRSIIATLLAVAVSIPVVTAAYLHASAQDDKTDSGPPPTSVSLDTQGVDFGGWIRRFVATVRRNWVVPRAASTKSGHCIVTFVVARNGKVSDIKIVQPSGVDEFDRAAFNAIAGSNPLEALPKDYPKDELAMTTTFYYNEQPPGTSTKGDTPSTSEK